MATVYDIEIQAVSDWVSFDEKTVEAELKKILEKREF